MKIVTIGLTPFNSGQRFPEDTCDLCAEHVGFLQDFQPSFGVVSIPAEFKDGIKHPVARFAYVTHGGTVLSLGEKCAADPVGVMRLTLGKVVRIPANQGVQPLELLQPDAEPEAK
jgi:hypothetical protein